MPLLERIKDVPSLTTLSWQCSHSTTNAISELLLFSYICSADLSLCVCVCDDIYIYIYIYIYVSSSPSACAGCVCAVDMRIESILVEYWRNFGGLDED